MIPAPEPEPAPIVDLLAAGKAAAAARATRWAPFWETAVAADARLSSLRDVPDTRAEVEARLETWAAAVAAQPFRRDWTKAEVDALAARVRAIRAEVADVFGQVEALGNLTDSDAMGEPLGVLFGTLLSVFDDLAPAVAAADALTALPARSGGRGAFTSEHRRREILDFGEGALSIFRRCGLSTGGNRDRDPALGAFLDAACRHVTGGPIPGRAALLSALRMR